MGISKNDCSLLFYSKKNGVSFNETLMLGRLNLFATKKDIISATKKYNVHEKNIDEVVFKDDYSEPLFEILGATKVDSVDYSAYEKATIVHDLNVPFSENLINKYTAVVDGGTIEHIFNFPLAIKNCMKALKMGGHYIGITPINNSMGHGFYQFSPELYYRVFSEENGFKVKNMFITVSIGDETQWYEVADPKIVKSRVTLMNNHPITLMVIAEKIAEKNIFETTPQQIDYTFIWDKSENNNDVKESASLKLYRTLLPLSLRVFIRNVLDVLSAKKTSDKYIGKHETKHFVKTEI